MVVIITLTSNNTVIVTAQDEHTEKNIFHILTRYNTVVESPGVFGLNSKII